MLDDLVKNPKQVKITDFGLAKMLDHDQYQISGSGGKVRFTLLAVYWYMVLLCVTVE